MNIANGKMEVGHFDHPGTTVQVGAGICIRLIYTFAGTEKDLSTDILSDPEKYLHVLSLIFILVNCLILTWSGMKIYKISGNIFTSLFLQTGTLIFFNTLAAMPNLRPETFLIWGTTIFTTICFSFISEKEISPRKMLGYAIKFGIIVAFLVVTKITALPLLLIPVVLLKKWKSWFLYGFSFLLSAILFLIPALNKMQYFFHWVHELIFKSGQYGSGEAKIIDSAVFKEGLHSMLKSDLLFVIVLAILLITILFLTLTKRFNYQAWKTNPRLRLMVAIFISSICCALIVAKAFKYHYLIPAYGLMMTGAFVSFSFFFSPERKISNLFHNKKIQSALLVLFLGFYTYNDYSQYLFYDGLCNPRAVTATFMEKNYKNVPRLYVTYEFYSAEKFPALYFGDAYSGMMRYQYVPILQKIYPNTYFYSYPENQFHDWEKSFEWSDFVSKNKKMLISFYFNDPYYLEGSLKTLNEINQFGRVIEIHKVFQNDKTGEQLYEMNRVGTFDHKLDSSRVIRCDAEHVTSLSLISDDSLYYFQGMECRTNKEAHSGKYSLQLNTTNQYGFVLHLALKKEKHYEISAWVKSDSGKGVLIATGLSNKAYYVSSSTVTETGNNGWKKIVLKFKVPDNYYEETIGIGAWNEIGDQVTYFDDFTIVEY
jgi:hypothetical protein